MEKVTLNLTLGFYLHSRQIFRGILPITCRIDLKTTVLYCMFIVW